MTRGIAQSALLAQGETLRLSNAEDVTSCVEYLKSVDGVSGDAIFIAGTVRRSPRFDGGRLRH